MRTGQVARLAGVNTETLRYYERRGLLATPQRTSAGYRAYDDEAIHTVRFVKRAQELGFSLADVEALLDLAAGGPESCDAARDLAEAKVADLDLRIAHLVAMRESLRQLVATCDGPRGTRECPLLGALDRCGANGGAI